MMLTQLADIARGAGLHVIETPGWEKRGHGPMVDVRTITAHHTANGGAAGNSPSLGTVVYGRPGLDGPLSHFVLARDGTVYVVAAGLCWHAGTSLRTDYENSHAIGIEAEAEGVPGAKGDWPPAQMDAYARLCRALVDHFGLDVADVRGHKETCSPPGRKSDPDFSMATFRSRVAATNLEDDVPLTTADADLVAKRLVENYEITLSDTLARAIGSDYKAGQKVTVGFLLAWSPVALRTDRDVVQLGQQVIDLNARVSALTQQLAGLAGNLTQVLAAVQQVGAAQPDAVTAAFTAGTQALDAHLGGLRLRVDTAQ